MDFLHRTWREFAAFKQPGLKSDQLKQFGRQSKEITHEYSQLRYEITTNKELTALEDDLPDCAHWNHQLQLLTEKMGCEPAYFDAPMLFSECYVYRRVNNFYQRTAFFKDFDGFWEQKRHALKESIFPTSLLSEHLFSMSSRLVSCQTNVREEFLNFLELCLWGNKCDLSLSGGEKVNQSDQLFSDLTKNRPKILCNNSEATWNFFQQLSTKNVTSPVRLDVVMDNAGFETISDFAFIIMLYQTGLLNKDTSTVRFFIKQIPWYVSDTTEQDFHYTVDYLCKQSDWPQVAKFGQMIEELVQAGRWTIVKHGYWTYPNDFSEMNKYSPDLYRDLAESDLLLFKGDLNYRKLVGDIDWPHTTRFEQALRGFTPTNILSLRTIKFNPVVHLESEEMVEKLPKNWYYSGEYALIHFLDRVNK